MLDTGLAVGRVAGAHVLPEVSLAFQVIHALLGHFSCIPFGRSDRSILLKAQLLKYLTTAIEGFPVVDSLDIKQFKHGQSNPTYLLQVSSWVPS